MWGFQRCSRDKEFLEHAYGLGLCAVLAGHHQYTWITFHVFTAQQCLCSFLDMEVSVL